MRKDPLSPEETSQIKKGEPSRGNPPRKKGQLKTAIALSVGTCLMLGIIGFEISRENTWKSNSAPQDLPSYIKTNPLSRSSGLPNSFNFTLEDVVSLQSENRNQQQRIFILRKELWEAQDQLNEAKKQLFARESTAEHARATVLKTKLSQKLEENEHLRNKIVTLQNNLENQNKRIGSLDAAIATLNEMIAIQKNAKQSVEQKLQDHHQLIANAFPAHVKNAQDLSVDGVLGEKVRAVQTKQDELLACSLDTIQKQLMLEENIESMQAELNDLNNKLQESYLREEYLEQALTQTSSEGASIQDEVQVLQTILAQQKHVVDSDPLIQSVRAAGNIEAYFGELQLAHTAQEVDQDKFRNLEHEIAILTEQLQSSQSELDELKANHEHVLTKTTQEFSSLQDELWAERLCREITLNNLQDTQQQHQLSTVQVQLAQQELSNICEERKNLSELCINLEAQITRLEEKLTYTQQAAQNTEEQLAVERIAFSKQSEDISTFLIQEQAFKEKSLQEKEQARQEYEEQIHELAAACSKLQEQIQEQNHRSQDQETEYERKLSLAVAAAAQLEDELLIERATHSIAPQRVIEELQTKYDQADIALKLLQAELEHHQVTANIAELDLYMENQKLDKHLTNEQHNSNALNAQLTIVLNESENQKRDLEERIAKHQEEIVNLDNLLSQEKQLAQANIDGTLRDTHKLLHENEENWHKENLALAQRLATEKSAYENLLEEMNALISDRQRDQLELQNLQAQIEDHTVNKQSADKLLEQFTQLMEESNQDKHLLSELEQQILEYRQDQEKLRASLEVEIVDLQRELELQQEHLNVQNQDLDQRIAEERTKYKNLLEELNALKGDRQKDQIALQQLQMQLEEHAISKQSSDKLIEQFNQLMEESNHDKLLLAQMEMQLENHKREQEQIRQSLEQEISKLQIKMIEDQNHSKASLEQALNDAMTLLQEHEASWKNENKDLEQRISEEKVAQELLKKEMEAMQQDRLRDQENIMSFQADLQNLHAERQAAAALQEQLNLLLEETKHDKQRISEYEEIFINQKQEQETTRNTLHQEIEILQKQLHDEKFQTQSSIATALENAQAMLTDREEEWEKQNALMQKKISEEISAQEKLMDEIDLLRSESQRALSLIQELQATRQES